MKPMRLRSLTIRLRSLTLKLTLAFLFVGLIGVGGVAAFVAYRTWDEFDRFMFERGRTWLLEELERYYRRNDGWQGIEQMFPGDASELEYRWNFEGDTPPVATLVDVNGIILLSTQDNRVGQKIAPEKLAQGIPIRVRDRVVGWLILENFPVTNRPTPTEQAFLKNIGDAILLGAVCAILVALVAGMILARTLTRPLRELTAAAQVMAAGKLGSQVEVRSQDELGDLARSFNQMSRDLAQANQQRRQMTADIAHDLRTPLSILLGYTEALHDGKLQGTPEIHRVMHQEAQHLSHLIDDLRTLSLADAGELKLNVQACLPYELLTHTAAAYQGQAGDKGITLIVKAGRDLPAISADPARMAQVLGNLVSNALRYTPAGGQITLSAVAGKTTVSLQVQDTGSGITPSDLPYIFNRFYRADEARQQRYGESGLGLAIAKSLVEAHGGSISVESIPNNGTTFTILLGQAEAV
jgi:signal transduction histidine kinase